VEDDVSGGPRGSLSRGKDLLDISSIALVIFEDGLEGKCASDHPPSDCTMKGLTVCVSALALVCLQQTASAFSTPTLKSTQASSVALKALGSSGEPNPLSYSEQSRAYRRDFYTHDSWLRARQKNRFIGTISKITQSGVVRQLFNEVALVGAVAAFVVFWNCLFVTGYDDFSMVHHAPIIDPVTFPLIKLPLEPFSLSSPALGLLLGKSSTPAFVPACMYVCISSDAVSTLSSHSHICTLIYLFAYTLSLGQSYKQLQSSRPTHLTNAGTKLARHGEWWSTTLAQSCVRRPRGR
jgi:hypothetical protein